MYEVQRCGLRAGREAVMVRDSGKLICSASIDFVNWMREKVPSKQLRPEQLALVEWCEQRAATAGEIGERIGIETRLTA